MIKHSANYEHAAHNLSLWFKAMAKYKRRKRNAWGGRTESVRMIDRRLKKTRAANG